MTTIRWTEAQIEAMIELGGAPPEPVQQPRPVVARGCICPNQHQPDSDGLIVTQPSCMIHGCRSRWPFQSNLSRDTRQMGTGHSGRNE
jgi:hypothetical protein